MNGADFTNSTRAFSISGRSHPFAGHDHDGAVCSWFRAHGYDPVSKHGVASGGVLASADQREVVAAILVGAGVKLIFFTAPTAEADPLAIKSAGVDVSQLHQTWFSKSFQASPRSTRGPAAANEVRRKRKPYTATNVRAAVGNPTGMSVTLTGHSGGGSFFWGFIDGQAALPA